MPEFFVPSQLHCKDHKGREEYRVSTAVLAICDGSKDVTAMRWSLRSLRALWFRGYYARITWAAVNFEIDDTG